MYNNLMFDKLIKKLKDVLPGNKSDEDEYDEDEYEGSGVEDITQEIRPSEMEDDEAEFEEEEEDDLAAKEKKKKIVIYTFFALFTAWFIYGEMNKEKPQEQPAEKVVKKEPVPMKEEQPPSKESEEPVKEKWVEANQAEAKPEPKMEPAPEPTMEPAPQPTPEVAMKPEAETEVVTDTSEPEIEPEPEPEVFPTSIPQADAVDTTADVSNVGEVYGETETETQEKSSTDLGNAVVSKMKEEIIKEKKKEYIAPPGYEEVGRGLVYNCVGKHWACVDKKTYFQCNANEMWNTENNKPIECKVLNVYASLKDCRKIQEYNINTLAKTDFCEKSVE